MPGRKRRFTKCGHFGHGAFCHRCGAADDLEKKASGMREGEKKTKLIEEAKRLRANGPVALSDISASISSETALDL